jgi:hypothetical protein
LLRRFNRASRFSGQEAKLRSSIMELEGIQNETLIPNSEITQLLSRRPKQKTTRQIIVEAGKLFSEMQTLKTQTDTQNYALHKYHVFRMGKKSKIDNITVEPIHVDHSRDEPELFTKRIHASELVIDFFRTVPLRSHIGLSVPQDSQSGVPLGGILSA